MQVMKMPILKNYDYSFKSIRNCLNAPLVRRAPARRQCKAASRFVMGSSTLEKNKRRLNNNHNNKHNNTTTTTSTTSTTTSVGGLA